LAYYYSHHPYYGAQWPHAWSYSGFYPAYPAYERPCLCGGSGSSGGGRQEDRQRPDLRDYGGNPHVINIEKAAEWNTDFRRAIWTGRHLQVVLMSIEPGSDIGLEVHPNVDQFIRIEEGFALVQMGPRRDNLNFTRRVSEDDAIMIPAGTWHNVTNIGPRPLKLYTIYAPPEHRFGTVHRTKAEAEAAHEPSV
jgi:mannose-6-phosphate isomerase-like protein (cupin superfamily)